MGLEPTQNCFAGSQINQFSHSTTVFQGAWCLHWDISLDNVSDYSHLDTSPETFVPTTGFEPVPPGLQPGALPIELRRHIDEFHIKPQHVEEQ